MPTIPGPVSSLTPGDMASILDELRSNHKTSSLKLCDLFNEIAIRYAGLLPATVESEWAMKLRTVSEFLPQALLRIRDYSHTEEWILSAHNIVVAGLAIGKAPTLLAFGSNMDSILNESAGHNPTPDAGKSLLGFYGELVFRFWLAIDQLDIDEETKEIHRETLNSTLGTVARAHPSMSLLAFKLLKGGMDSNLQSVVMDEVLVLKYPSLSADDSDVIQILELD